MNDSFKVSLVYRNDKESNTLAVSIVSEPLTIGGALDVTLDESTNECVLTFWDEDGTSQQARSLITDALISVPADLGTWALNAGYYVEPECESFVGLYILERFDRLWVDSIARCQIEHAEPATKTAQ